MSFDCLDCGLPEATKTRSSAGFVAAVNSTVGKEVSKVLYVDLRLEKVVEFVQFVASSNKICPIVGVYLIGTTTTSYKVTECSHEGICR